MIASSGSSGRRRAPAAAALLLATLTLSVAGCGAASSQNATSTGQVSAETTTVAPPAAASTAAPTTSAPTTSGPTGATLSPTQAAAPIAKPPAPATKGPLLSASDPISLAIPDIGLTTSLLQLGRDANGEAEVPPEVAGTPAGWYKYSPTPGELGPSVILGHVNTSTIAEGVFYRLNELTPGEEFTVTRADGSLLVFAVDRSEIFQKATFPTLAVYGNTDRAEIRLITCGGYEPSTGEFLENMVVYGHLISSSNS